MSNPCEPERAVAPDRADSLRRRPVKAGRIGLPILPARRREGKEARAKALELRAKFSCSRLRRYPLQSGRRPAAPDAASKRQPHLTAGCSRSSMDSYDAAGDFASGVGAAALANDERHGRDEKTSSPYSTSRFWRRWAASRNPCAFPAIRRRSKRRGIPMSLHPIMPACNLWSTTGSLSLRRIAPLCSRERTTPENSGAPSSNGLRTDSGPIWSLFIASSGTSCLRHGGAAKSSAAGQAGCRRPEVPIVSSRGRSHGSRSWLGRRGQFTPGLRRAVNDFRDPRR